MTDEEIEERLAQIDERLERLERLAYVSFDDVRRVAEYAYQCALWEPELGEAPLRRMSKMRALSDEEATRNGLSTSHRIVLKAIWKVLGFGVRHDALAIAREMAERTMARVDEPQEAEEKVSA